LFPLFTSFQQITVVSVQFSVFIYTAERDLLAIAEFLSNVTIAEEGHNVIIVDRSIKYSRK